MGKNVKITYGQPLTEGQFQELMAKQRQGNKQTARVVTPDTDTINKNVAPDKDKVTKQ